MKVTVETFNFSKHPALKDLPREGGRPRAASSCCGRECRCSFSVRQRESTDFLVIILRFNFSFWGHIPWYSQFWYNTHLKSQICSNIFDILGSNLCIPHIAHLFIHDFISEWMNNIAPSRTESDRNTWNAHFSKLYHLPHGSGLCYEPHPSPSEVTALQFQTTLCPHFTVTHRL